ncbi:hypothetical protein HFO77_25440 [Rhizobium leguminosarum]|uniref:hypothetical protein n=1 Tax=Rhizobium leguminosarum TaxID=384 RepID=UPI001C96397A|nr:hypothetical protein [Rhizobium leguminosarum]MBY5917740.1 hypothetical protein [Rhizobium leguminosarum]
MAEDIREQNPDAHQMTDRRTGEIAAEALRQSESCLYTSTAIFIWLRTVRWQQKAVVLAPILLTGLAGFGYFKDVVPAWVLALMGFLSTLIPALADALNIETHVDDLKTKAAEYKALQDRFRKLARIGVLGDSERAEGELSELLDRLDVVRSSSITPPERYFEEARKKIKRGDYDFSIDIELRQLVSDAEVKPMPEAQ